MKDFTIAIYCFIDDLLQKIQENSLHKRGKLSDSQVPTTAIVSAKYFYGNHHAACVYMRDHWGFNIPDKSNFNRQLHKLSDLLIQLFYHLSAIFKHLNLESVYIIDSFPVAVCKNIRISCSKLLKGEKYRGFNASKKEYFYGVKVHMITTGEGLPVDILITAGSIHDNTAMQMMGIDLPDNSHLYADAAYVNQDVKETLLQLQNIKFKVATKKNALEKNHPALAMEINYFRKTIENTFSEITYKFPKKIHAVTPAGFLLKLLFAIITFAINKLLN